MRHTCQGQQKQPFLNIQIDKRAFNADKKGMKAGQNENFSFIDAYLSTTPLFSYPEPFGQGLWLSEKAN